jgi:hypothetical protein
MVTIQIFAYLQLLDFITTLVGFRVGAGEASPFISKLMHISSPVMGVAASKLLAITIGGICLYSGRRRLLGWVNYWYAGLVVWNLVIILIAIR